MRLRGLNCIIVSAILGICGGMAAADFARICLIANDLLSDRLCCTGAQAAKNPII
jgi:hypothetical protein